MRQKLVAARPFTYATRSMQIGDEFDAPRVDARALVATGRATIYTPDPLAPLRDEADGLGIKVDLRWGEKRLQDEIEEARKPKRAPKSKDE